MTFFKNQDGVRDVWHFEDPSRVWFFRGAPHVHCWAHIRPPQAA